MTRNEQITKSEVGQLHRFRLVEEDDIFRLQITMDHMQLVAVGYRINDLNHQQKRLWNINIIITTLSLEPSSLRLRASERQQSSLAGYTVPNKQKFGVYKHHNTLYSKYLSALLSLYVKKHKNFYNVKICINKQSSSIQQCFTCDE